MKTLLDQDLASARQQNPRLKLEKEMTLPTRLQKSAIVRLYSGLKDGAAEATAYIEEKEPSGAAFPFLSQPSNPK